MGQLDTAASEADSAEEEAPEEVTGALEAPEAGEAAVEAPEAVSAPVKVSVAETGGVGVPVLRQRPKKAAGNSHAAAVKFLKSAYLQGKSGYGGDHVCESANGLEATNLGYGEVAVSGMETLYSVLNISAGDVFYDLGSGTGKLPLYVALRGEVSSSTGIEVGERRHRLAEEAGVRLKSELAKGTERAADDPPPAELDAECSAYSLVLGDIRQSIYSDATVVVMSNLCMDQSVQNRAVQNLLACPGLRNMASTVPLPAHQRLQRDRAVNVTCTWAKTSTWHIYSVLPPASKLKQSGGVGVGYGRSPAAAVASRILRPLQLAKPGLVQGVQGVAPKALRSMSALARLAAPAADAPPAVKTGGAARVPPGARGPGSKGSGAKGFGVRSPSREARDSRTCLEPLPAEA
ncbi:unnamed protein product [Polarella glacialis]|uniref:Histone-lysine N-methyltransferase, H3 lysine-79 specific n=1 Tax=Polarella glacialis TaxID=89957 RepID=A0A813JCC3_POLGL|nr:unnamed protein product [Polarella glacialis]